MGIDIKQLEGINYHDIPSKNQQIRKSLAKCEKKRLEINFTQILKFS